LLNVSDCEVAEVCEKQQQGMLINAESAGALSWEVNGNLFARWVRMD
jgi:hypothetical protein